MAKNMAAVVPYLSEDERARCWVAVRGYGQPAEAAGLILQDAQKIYNHYSFVEKLSFTFPSAQEIIELRGKIKKYCLTEQTETKQLMG